VEQLLPWVEQELKQLRQSGADLAARYPRVAGRLGDAGRGRGAEVGRDPHVERLVQAAAVLHARIAHGLDRAGPLLDERLLEALYPGQLRPSASAAVFRLGGDARCGTVLRARGSDGRSYRFRLVADAARSGVELGSLGWRPYAGPGREHLLSLTLSLPALTPRSPAPGACKRLRLYVHAEPVLRAALLDAMLMHASAAWVQAGAGGMAALPVPTIRLAGLDETGDSAWQGLRGYQCFGDRFNFVDLDLAALLRQVPAAGNEVTLHIALPVRVDGELAQVLARAEAGNLLTGCAPAVNLFPAAAAPVDVTGLASEYGLQPADPSHVIYSIDSVSLQRGRVLEVLRQPQAVAYAQAPARTWTARRALADECGPPMRIAFEPAPGSEAGTASAALTCCDRAVPAKLEVAEPAAALVGAVTKMCEVSGGRALRWRLLAMLALEARSPDAESLRLAFSLQDLPDSEAAHKLQSAVVDVQLLPATLAVPHRHGSAPIDGTEVRVTIDERALVGASVAVFVHVIDQYLSTSVHLNTFMQLVAVSAGSGGELMRCRPRNGNLML